MPRSLQVASSSSSNEREEVAVPPLPAEDVEDMEEDDRTLSNLNLQGITLSSSESISRTAPRHPNTVQPVPFNISDDDIGIHGDGNENENESESESENENVAGAGAGAGAGIDNVSSGPNRGNSTGNHPCTDGPISTILQGMGLRLRREWLESCIQGLESSVQGFSGFNDSTKAKLCFEQFLQADMNFCGAGCFSENVHSLHMVDLKGPFVLQVDEIVNISCQLKTRYQKAAAGIKRCLKLSMTDGVQRVFGMEYRPIKDLEVPSPAGLKIVINNVNVRHGLLMLVPEVIEVLGGKVQVLAEAQERLIHEINKPPRGRRTKNGSVIPLARRATLAAWPSERTSEQNSGRSGMSPIQIDQQAPSSDNSASHENRECHAHPVQSQDAQVYRVTRLEQQAANMSREQSAGVVGREQAQPSSFDEEVMDIDDHIVDNLQSPFMFPVDNESPFTYLAVLSAKLAGMVDGTSKVQGKIKCFLTGVKGFQYKHRTTYELRVYVDDGSLISEILIEHNVVQRGIGYSPTEVSSALASSDKRQVSSMKETLKQFQSFLVSFEGIMHLEMSKTSSIPVAIEMDHGCPASYACLLLQRVKSSGSASQQESPHTNVITLSP